MSTGLIYINSQDRISGDRDSFVVNFSNPIKPGTYKFSACSIPMNCYAIGVNSCSLTFTEAATSGVSRTFSIAVGNYTPSNILSPLGMAMTTAGTQTYTWTHNSLNDTFTVSAAAAFSLTMPVSTTNIANLSLLYYRLGFTNTQQTAAISQTSTNGTNLSTPVQVFISLSNCMNESSISNKNVSAKLAVPVDAGPGYVLIYNDLGQKITVNQNTNSMAVTLSDTYGQPLLMRSEWAVTLAGV